MAESVDLVVWNANNHQTTWGVLGAAVEALRECMRVNGWGVGRFGIWDGGIEVGGGGGGEVVGGGGQGGGGGGGGGGGWGGGGGVGLGVGGWGGGGGRWGRLWEGG